MSNREINDLMVLVQNGDENSFANLFELLKKEVFVFIYSYVKNYHTAEDLVQETFIKVKTKADLYEKSTNARAWILQIAKNTAIDYLRKDNKLKTVELNDNIEKTESNPENKLFLHDLMNEFLSEDERQIIILHLLYGYKNREIAKILDLPIGTVLWKYNVSLKKLKGKLKEAGYEK